MLVLCLCAYIFSSEFTYMSLVITICCLHMRQLMVDMYQSNHCEFSFSNKSDLLVHLYTRSDDGTYHDTYCYIPFTRVYLLKLEDMLGHTVKKIHINIGIVKRVLLCKVT